MADISTEIQKIGQAVYGEEVRGAIMDALEAMNEQAESAEAWATGGEGGTAAADNNAKYYAEQAAAQAAAASSAAASGVAALANEAPTFSATDVYVAGNYVIYNNSLYRFKVNHAAGAWNSSDVEQVYVGAALGSIDSAAKSANCILTMADGAVPIDFIKLANVGIKYADGTEVSSSSFCATDYIDIRAFSEITYSRMYLTALSVNTGLAFYRDDKTYISGVTNVANQSDFSYQDYTVTVPETAAYVRCTISKGRVGGEDDQFHISGVSKLSGVMAAEQTARQLADTALSAIDAAVSGASSVAIPYAITGTSGMAIAYDTGAAIGNSAFGYTDYMDIRKYAKLTYKRVTNTSSTSRVGMAFYDDSKTYVFGVSAILGAESYGYAVSTVAVPPGAAYARFSTLLDTTTYGEFSVSGASVFGGQESYFELEPAYPFVLDDGYGYINQTTGALTASDNFAPSDYIECGGFDMLRYTRYISIGTVTNIGLAFYDSSKQFIPRSGEPGIGGQAAVGTAERTIPIPEGAAYVRFSYPSHARMLELGIGNFSLTLIKIGTLEDRTALIDGKTDPGIGLYPYKPRSEGAANVVRRAHQMANVEWTALSAFTRQIKTDSVTTTQFAAGAKYRGIPYAVTLERVHSVNVDVSIDTFMSAIENPNTRMYDGTASGYPYYGAVCSAFVSGALGLRMEPVTRDMPAFAWFDLIAEDGTFNEYDLEIGDIFLKADSHVALVTGILTDAAGIIKWIEISEETLYGYITGGYARCRWFTPSRLFNRFVDYDLYRYRYIDDVEYHPNVHSQVLPEQKSVRNESRYCYSVYGDKDVRGVSSTPLDIKIASGAYAAGYNTLRVFKDGAVYQETAITAQTETVTVPRTETGAYRAYLVNVSDVDEDGPHSDAISWDVIGGTFSKAVDGTTLTLTYDTKSVVYGIKYNQPGVPMNQYVPCLPRSGSGTVTFEIPVDATSLAVVLGNKRGTIRVSV